MWKQKGFHFPMHKPCNREKWRQIYCVDTKWRQILLLDPMHKPCNNITGIHKVYSWIQKQLTQCTRNIFSNRERLMKKIGQRAKNVSVMKLDQYSNEKSKYMTLAEFLPLNANISKWPKLRLHGLCIVQPMMTRCRYS